MTSTLEHILLEYFSKQKHSKHCGGSIFRPDTCSCGLVELRRELELLVNKKPE